MKRRTITALSITFLIIIIGMFGYAYLQQDATSTMPGDVATTTPDTDTTGPTAYDYIDRIDATHYFIDDTHTLVGQVSMPTPCDLVETDVQVQESYPETIQIDFSVINNADMCAQVMTEQRFMVEVDASPDATFTAELEGRPVELNLIPAPEGETPEEYELYQKG